MSALYTSKLIAARERLSALRSLRDEGEKGSSSAVSSSSSTRRWQKSATLVKPAVSKRHNTKLLKAPIEEARKAPERHNKTVVGSEKIADNFLSVKTSPTSREVVLQASPLPLHTTSESHRSLPSLTPSPPPPLVKNQGSKQIALSPDENKDANKDTEAQPQSTIPPKASPPVEAQFLERQQLAYRLETTLALLLDSTREQARLRGVIEALAGPEESIRLISSPTTVTGSAPVVSAREKGLLAELDRAVAECVTWRSAAVEAQGREASLKRAVAQLSGVVGDGDAAVSNGSSEKETGKETVVNVEVDLGNGRTARLALLATSDPDDVARRMVAEHRLHRDAVAPLTMFIRQTLNTLSSRPRTDRVSKLTKAQKDKRKSQHGKTHQLQEKDLDLDTTLIDSDSDDGDKVGSGLCLSQHDGDTPSEDDDDSDPPTDSDHDGADINGTNLGINSEASARSNKNKSVLTSPRRQYLMAPESRTQQDEGIAAAKALSELQQQLKFEKDRVRLKEDELASQRELLHQERARAVRTEAMYQDRLGRREKEMMNALKAERRRSGRVGRVSFGQVTPFNELDGVGVGVVDGSEGEKGTVPSGDDFYQPMTMPPAMQHPHHYRQPHAMQTYSSSSGQHVPEQPQRSPRHRVVNPEYHSRRAPSPRRIAKGRFHRGVALFDSATDLANKGHIVDAQPVYAEALGIFRELNIPELDRVENEVRYWKEMAERQVRREQHTVSASAGHDSGVEDRTNASKDLSSVRCHPQGPHHHHHQLPQQQEREEDGDDEATHPTCAPTPTPTPTPPPPPHHPHQQLQQQQRSSLGSADDFVRDLEDLLGDVGIETSVPLHLK